MNVRFTVYTPEPQDVLIAARACARLHALAPAEYRNDLGPARVTTLLEGSERAVIDACIDAGVETGLPTEFCVEI
jgi:hypothetical protein